MYRLIMIMILQFVAQEFSFGQTEPDPRALLREINEYIHSAPSLHLRMDYQWFETNDSQEALDTQTSLYLRKGNWQYSSMDGKTMIIDKGKVAMIYESEKVVLLQPLIEGAGPAMFSLHTDSLIKAYESVSLKKEGSDLILVCHLDDPTYERIELLVDQTHRRILRATIFFSDWAGGKPRLEISCSYLQFPTVSELNSSYSLEHVVINPGPKARLTSAYQAYQFHNQFAQP